ncbi:MAG TPA: hypothetical protein VHD56_14750 [Tepidisphaeraceae bacterium]|nr:hypothetical protein [Tepidisphaeraceae bacterium]
MRVGPYILSAIILGLILQKTWIFAADAPAKDLLPKNSHWTGTQEGDERQPNTPQAQTVPAELKVLERSGEDFALEYDLGKNGARGILHLEGKIRGSQMIAQMTKVIKGAWDVNITELVWNGQINEDEMVLQWQNSKNLIRISRFKMDPVVDSPGAGRAGRGGRRGRRLTGGQSHRPILFS